MERKRFDYINVIPLVDVMLVLLTITLTTSSFIATGFIPLKLPSASLSSHEIRLKTQTIEIDRNGKIYLNAKPVSLITLRNRIIPLNRNTPILIRADREIDLQTFVDVYDTVKSLNFKKIGLSIEEKR